MDLVRSICGSVDLVERHGARIRLKKAAYSLESTLIHIGTKGRILSTVTINNCWFVRMDNGIEATFGKPWSAHYLEIIGE